MYTRETGRERAAERDFAVQESHMARCRVAVRSSISQVEENSCLILPKVLLHFSHSDSWRPYFIFCQRCGLEILPHSSYQFWGESINNYVKRLNRPIERAAGAREEKGSWLIPPNNLTSVKNTATVPHNHLLKDYYFLLVCVHLHKWHIKKDYSWHLYRALQTQQM